MGIVTVTPPMHWRCDYVKLLWDRLQLFRLSLRLLGSSSNVPIPDRLAGLMGEVIPVGL